MEIQTQNARSATYARLIDSLFNIEASRQTAEPLIQVNERIKRDQARRGSPSLDALETRMRAGLQLVKSLSMVEFLPQIAGDARYVLGIDSGNSMALYYYGVAMMYQGQYDQAVSNLNDGTRILTSLLSKASPLSHKTEKARTLLNMFHHSTVVLPKIRVNNSNKLDPLRLPNELVDMIFEHIPSETLYIARGVCSRWKLAIERSDVPWSGQSLALVFDQSKNVDETIRRFLQLSNGRIDTIPGNLGVGQNTDDLLKLILQHSPRLHTLSLDGMRRPEMLLHVLHPEKLESLRIQRRQVIPSVADFQSPFDNNYVSREIVSPDRSYRNPQLTGLKQLTLADDAVFPEDFVRISPNLEEIVLQNFCLWHPLKEALSIASGLKALTVDCRLAIPIHPLPRSLERLSWQAGATFFGDNYPVLPKLQVLEIQEENGLYARIAEHWCNLLEFSRCKLKCLRISKGPPREYIFSSAPSMIVTFLERGMLGGLEEIAFEYADDLGFDHDRIFTAIINTCLELKVLRWPCQDAVHVRVAKACLVKRGRALRLTDWHGKTLRFRERPLRVTGHKTAGHKRNMTLS